MKNKISCSHNNLYPTNHVVTLNFFQGFTYAKGCVYNTKRIRFVRKSPGYTYSIDGFIFDDSIHSRLLIERILKSNQNEILSLFIRETLIRPRRKYQWQIRTLLLSFHNFFLCWWDWYEGKQDYHIKIK